MKETAWSGLNASSTSGCRRICGTRRDRDHRKPDAHDRPEQRGDPRGAARLHRKQRQQDDHRQRHHIRIERHGDELDALDRRQHRQRRRDHGVAVKQRAADDAEQDDHAGPCRQPRAAPAPSAPACRPRRCCRRAAGSTRISASRRRSAPTGSATERRARPADRRSPVVPVAQRSLHAARRAGWCRCRHRRRRCCRASAPGSLRSNAPRHVRLPPAFPRAGTALSVVMGEASMLHCTMQQRRQRYTSLRVSAWVSAEFGPQPCEMLHGSMRDRSSKFTSMIR